LLLAYAGVAGAIVQLPSEGGQAGKAQEEAVQKQRNEYQVFRFEQEQKQKKRELVEKSERKVVRKIKTGKEKTVEGLVKAAQPGFFEQMLNMVAAAIMVLAFGCFAYGLYLRSAKKAQAGNQRSSPTSGSQTNHRSGVSALEMLLVLAFISIAFLSVLQLLSGSVISSGEMKGSVTAQNLANQKVELLLNESFYSLTSEARTAFADFPDYAYTVTVSSLEAHLKSVAVVIFWSVGGKEMSYEVQTMFSDW
jgi:hypothetical protein